MARSLIALAFLMLLAPMVFALDPAAQTSLNDAQAACVAKNPAGREVWRFETGPPGENHSLGGAVETTVITPDLTAYCVQVDCIQSPMETPLEPQYCADNHQLLMRNYAVNYVFPQCDSVYTEQTRYQPDPICMVCPPAVITTGWSDYACLNGHQTQSRQITTYYNSTCTPHVVNQIRITNNGCLDTPHILLIAVSVLVLGGWYFFVRKK